MQLYSTQNQCEQVKVEKSDPTGHGNGIFFCWFFCHIPVPDMQQMFFLLLFATFQYYQSSCFRMWFFFLPYPDLSLHHVSGVSPPFFSLTMKYSDTNLGVPSTLEHSCVAVPLSRYRAPRLPTLPLSSTNSDAVSIPTHCLLSVISSSPSFYSPCFRHSLYKRMAASKIRAKQSQHSHEHLFTPLALVLHFTFDFSVSVRGTPVRAASVWRATRLSKCTFWIKNTAYATDVTLRCDKEQPCSTHHRQHTPTWTEKSAGGSGIDRRSGQPLL